MDWPDAAIVAAHGYDAGDGWGALMRNSELGTCSLVMGAGASGSTFVGDNNLKFLHASSCLSLLNQTFSISNPDLRTSFRTARQPSTSAAQPTALRLLRWTR